MNNIMRFQGAAMLAATAVALSVCTWPLTTAAQDPAEKPPSKRDAADPSAEKSSQPTKREALERKFAETLTGAILLGSWQMTGPDGLKGKAPLTEPRTEKYTIDKVAKTTGEHWIITARIEYADKDVRVPVPVRVKWAGDTPIITLDRISIPLIGEYSARVMIYGKFYAGTWFGKDYGGILSGQIIRPADLEKIEKAKAARPKAEAKIPKSKPLVKPEK